MSCGSASALSHHPLRPRQEKSGAACSLDSPARWIRRTASGVPRSSHQPRPNLSPGFKTNRLPSPGTLMRVWIVMNSTPRRLSNWCCAGAAPLGRRGATHSALQSARRSRRVRGMLSGLTLNCSRPQPQFKSGQSKCPIFSFRALKISLWPISDTHVAPGSPPTASFALPPSVLGPPD
jgi:hypothetical protein